MNCLFVSGPDGVVVPTISEYVVVNPDASFQPQFELWVKSLIVVERALEDHEVLTFVHRGDIDCPEDMTALLAPGAEPPDWLGEVQRAVLGDDWLRRDGADGTVRMKFGPDPKLALQEDVVTDPLAFELGPPREGPTLDGDTQPLWSSFSLSLKRGPGKYVHLLRFRTSFGTSGRILTSFSFAVDGPAAAIAALREELLTIKDRERREAAAREIDDLWAASKDPLYIITVLFHPEFPAVSGAVYGEDGFGRPAYVSPLRRLIIERPPHASVGSTTDAYHFHDMGRGSASGRFHVPFTVSIPSRLQVPEEVLRVYEEIREDREKQKGGSHA